MKKMFKVLVLGIVTAMVMIVASTPIFAQGDLCADFDANEALYNKYLDNYKGDITRNNVKVKEMAVAAAKEYTEKYGACPDFAAQVKYLTKAGPKLQEKIDEKKKIWERDDRYDRFNTAMKAKNTSEIFTSGADILQHEPDYLDVTIILASVGFDEAAVKKNDTYNNETIKYATKAIEKINADIKSDSGKFGEHGYQYDTKENALGWMTYSIGWIKYYRQKKEDEGLAYLYKSTQFDSETKKKPLTFVLMGDRYKAQAIEIKDKVVKVLELNKGVETFESKSLDALLRGYVDRAMDSYAKAYLLNNANKKTEAANALYETMKGLYRFRFETPGTIFADPELKTRLDSFISSVENKTIPGPNAEVQPVDPPVKEEETKTDAADSSTSMGKTDKKPETKTNGTKPKN